MSHDDKDNSQPALKAAAYKQDETPSNMNASQLGITDWRNMTFEGFFTKVKSRLRFNLDEEVLEQIEEFLHAAEKYQGEYASSLRKLSKKLDKKMPSIQTIGATASYAKHRDGSFTRIQQEYPFTLIARSDGNCFYRSVIFAYVSILLLKRKWHEIIALISRIASISRTIEYTHRKLSQSWNNTNLLTSMLVLFLYECVQECLDETKPPSLSKIVEKYNAQPIVDAALVIFGRNIIRVAFQENIESHLEDQTADERELAHDFAKGMSTFGIEANSTIFPFTAEALKIKLNVQNLFHVSGTTVQSDHSEFLPLNCDEVDKLESVTVCFTKKSYNTLYSHAFTLTHLKTEKKQLREFEAPAEIAAPEDGDDVDVDDDEELLDELNDDELEVDEDPVDAELAEGQEGEEEEEVADDFEQVEGEQQNNQRDENVREEREVEVNPEEMEDEGDFQEEAAAFELEKRERELLEVQEQLKQLEVEQVAEKEVEHVAEEEEEVEEFYEDAEDMEFTALDLENLKNKFDKRELRALRENPSGGLDLELELEREQELLEQLEAVAKAEAAGIEDIIEIADENGDNEKEEERRRKKAKRQEARGLKDTGIPSEQSLSSNPELNLGNAKEREGKGKQRRVYYQPLWRRFIYVPLALLALLLMLRRNKKVHVPVVVSQTTMSAVKETIVVVVEKSKEIIKRKLYLWE